MIVDRVQEVMSRLEGSRSEVMSGLRDGGLRDCFQVSRTPVGLLAGCGMDGSVRAVSTLLGNDLWKQRFCSRLTPGLVNDK